MLDNYVKNKLKICVQGKTSTDEAKSGIPSSEWVALVESIIKNMKNLEFSGLMTIGTLNAPPEADFQRLIETRKEVCEKLNLDPNNVELSMGMSGDYLKAMEMGSTNVRVGSSIFGAREYAQKKQNLMSLIQK